MTTILSQEEIDSLLGAVVGRCETEEGVRNEVFENKDIEEKKVLLKYMMNALRKHNPDLTPWKHSAMDEIYSHEEVEILMRHVRKSNSGTGA